MTEIPELTAKDLARALPARVRKRLMLGQIESGEDISALRRFIGLTQAQLAQAMSISVHTLRNWEQGRRHPDGPALALLRIAARHPRVIRENLESAALFVGWLCAAPDLEPQHAASRVRYHFACTPSRVWNELES